MNELTVTGISAGGQDYKENDKLIKLLTPEQGVIHAVMKGVKKEKAKLKFAAMPFSLCEYQLIERGGFYTVKTAVEQGSLFGLANDPDKYLIGSIILESGAAAMGSAPAPELFVYLLNGLYRLLHSETDAYSTGVNFVLNTLIRSGHYNETADDKPFMSDITEQETLPRNMSVPRLKKLVHIFQDRLGINLKSASVL